MRDLVLTVVLLGLMPVSYRRPFVGLLVFSWLAYMRPQDLAFSFAKNVRWSFYVALVMFAGYFSRGKVRLLLPDVRTWILILLVILVGIGILTGDHIGAKQVSRYVEFAKIVAIAFFTAAVVTNRERLRALMWVIAFSLGFYGVKNGIYGVATLGRTHVLRGPGGMLLDNNDLSLALAMAVPMLFHLGWTEREEHIKKAFWISVPLTVITVGLTRSRGGFLSLSASVGVLVWRSKNRIFGIVIALLAGTAGLLLAPKEYKERLASIADYQEEGSAQSRLRAWGVAIRMASDNPWFGVGFARFPKHFVEYVEDPTPQELAGQDIIVAHNSYLQIWAECGTPAILLYLSLIAISFATIWRVRALARRRYDSSWILNYCTMFEAALTAFVVGSTFLNRAHFDLFYHFVAIVMVFGRIAVREMRNDDLLPVKQTGVRGPLRLAEPRGFERKDRLRRGGRGFAPQRV